ncbi:class I SAM-dependent methyltransferase [Gordonia desulfuricans]|uniref:Class I SAM-dependent methyltransferase n=1 Tax=Gordonia desulfuricans TaxID=89051 RepID=A0A7K3LXU6_9ACTN|nr:MULTISPECIES: mycofactocin oligosaccharide methyltransferase MftM [Gordonia]EMP12233.2 methyltransferase type 11 [Gordonia sp. NB41Y]NDK92357.1 class I SAM-dependent methyltransferase [Gordonia desulfuricans]WLP91398.1 mycofactocin oligosaccharide methyltransferase MftM [Gordonia sp. NB41Y]
MTATLTTSAGVPTDRRIAVRRSSIAPRGFHRAGRVAWQTDVLGRVEVVHSLTLDDLSDDSLVSGLVALVDAGAIGGQWEFEETAVGIIRSCSADPDVAWSAFYDNSVAALRSGIAAFSPVHRRARSLISGRSVLEVGSCFGFFALQCAQDGHQVAACDISPGAVGLLDAAARRRGTPVHAVVGDATDLPFADDAVDTVTLIHLLEHLTEPQVRDAIGQALRVARRRVVIAIPYEEHPSEHFGHLTTLSEDDLRRWADAVPHAGAQFHTDHGGWLVLTPRD